ncbi:MAG: hypothetical protein AB1806_10105 [Acidobacteriota bacterium]
MPLEISQVRRRVQQRLAELRRVAAARRERTIQAERDYEPFRAMVALPVFNAVAQSLAAEGHPYRVLTPGGSLRLVSDRSTRTYVEIRLDTSGPSPVVVVETSRERGHRVIADERAFCAGERMTALTEEDVLAVLIEALGDLIER